MLKRLKKIINCYYNDDPFKEYINWADGVELKYKREGQDVRYALNDDKLKALGWQPTQDFNEQILKIVQFYKKNFRW